MSTIDRTLVAEVYEALGDPRATLARALASHDRPDDATADALEDVLLEVPDAPVSQKHKDECWKRHASCLAEKLYAEVLGWELDA